MLLTYWLINKKIGTVESNIVCNLPRSEVIKSHSKAIDEEVESIAIPFSMVMTVPVFPGCEKEKKQ